ncbi:unnamed protein product [Bursaphelenchus okinawaensis]|uniref:UNC93-like protein n=1 Tax=Bursaphelenchus okinawaensis TaxID=465554 RepID=A0A811K6K5_9BILA|nr:unnamed protein product [Bursaphelenchus okinawaensis]CAG9092485.1 unnamed protein product [Bursaphelenchus okinawaensis]
MDGNTGNAWDLVGDDDNSRVTTSGTMEEESEIDSQEASQILEEEEKKLEERRQRSKSPAVESLRKVSRMVLERVGIRKKKQPFLTLSRRPELPYFDLDLFCDKPKEFFYTQQHKIIPKILSSTDLLSKKLTSLGNKEKCSYLFKSQDSEDNNMAEAIIGTMDPERLHIYDPYCPIHGSRREIIKKRHQLIDMSGLASVEDVETDQLAPILSSNTYAAKAIRKRQRALSGLKGIHVAKEKRKILWNLFTISAAFLFLFTGFQGLQNLQTSVNDQLGGDSLSIMYLSLAISSLFVPNFVVNRLGSKLTLITAFGIMIIYMLANFLPQYYSLLPASVLAGVAASCMWSACSYYITQSGINYAKLNIEAQNTVSVRFFGTFFMIVHVGQVLGSLLSSVILSQSVVTAVIVDEADRTCGSGFPRNLSLLSDRAKLNLQRPSLVAYRSVVAVYLCCAMVALMIVAFFLNALKRDEINSKQPPKFSAEVLKQTLKNLQKPKVLLLIPLTIFNGIEQTFAVGIYTKAFVGCGLGISQIGYVMTTFGVSDAICSLVFGPLIRMFGRMPLFVFGAVMNVLMIMTLMIWPLNPGDRVLFNVIAGVWGMADSVWNTQVQGFWVGLTGRTSLEVAIANYRFWMSFGMAIGFFIARFTTVNSYLAVSFVILLIGILGYFATEMMDIVIAQFKTHPEKK